MLFVGIVVGVFAAYMVFRATTSVLALRARRRGDYQLSGREWDTFDWDTFTRNCYWKRGD